MRTTQLGALTPPVECPPLTPNRIAVNVIDPNQVYDTRRQPLYGERTAIHTVSSLRVMNVICYNVSHWMMGDIAR